VEHAFSELQLPLYGVLRSSLDRDSRKFACKEFSVVTPLICESAKGKRGGQR
jgi:hypothetical protein